MTFLHVITYFLNTRKQLFLNTFNICRYTHIHIYIYTYVYICIYTGTSKHLASPSLEAPSGNLRQSDPKLSGLLHNVQHALSIFFLFIGPMFWVLFSTYWPPSAEVYNIATMCVKNHWISAGNGRRRRRSSQIFPMICMTAMVVLCPKMKAPQSRVTAPHAVRMTLGEMRQSVTPVSKCCQTLISVRRKSGIIPAVYHRGIQSLPLWLKLQQPSPIHVDHYGSQYACQAYVPINHPNQQIVSSALHLHRMGPRCSASHPAYLSLFPVSPRPQKWEIKVSNFNPLSSKQRNSLITV